MGTANAWTASQRTVKIGYVIDFFVVMILSKNWLLEKERIVAEAIRVEVATKGIVTDYTLEGLRNHLPGRTFCFSPRLLTGSKKDEPLSPAPKVKSRIETIPLLSRLRRKRRDEPLLP